MYAFIMDDRCHELLLNQWGYTALRIIVHKSHASFNKQMTPTTRSSLYHHPRDIILRLMIRMSVFGRSLLISGQNVASTT